uniref:Uncharacterized protein n=1 Tax=Arundo donax TaxID=35708 RepID=A0A0A9F4T6_ARUDO
MHVLLLLCFYSNTTVDSEITAVLNTVPLANNGPLFGYLV